MGSPKYTKLWWQRSWLTSSDTYLAHLLPILKIPNSVYYIHKVKLEPWEVITSYDVKVLFTWVPVDPSIAIVQQKLQQDPPLSQRTSMSIPQIINLLEFYLKNTYFLFQGKYYEQVHGAAMGSPISSLIANLFMEEFDVKAITAPTPMPMAQVCRWHLCHSTSSANPTTSPAHQFTGPTHSIYQLGTQPGWLLTLVGCYGFPRPRQHLNNYHI